MMVDLNPGIIVWPIVERTKYVAYGHNLECGGLVAGIATPETTTGYDTSWVSHHLNTIQQDHLLLRGVKVSALRTK